MRKVRRHAAVGALALSLLTPMVVVAVPQSAAAATTVSTVTAESEQGDTIGAGGSFLWRPGLGTITAARDEQNRVVVTAVGNGSDTFTFTLAGPGGADLAVGAYTDARDFASRTTAQPGLEVTAGDRSCLTSAGRFEVREFAADLSRLLVLYESGCGGGRPALFGELRINMPVGDGPLVTPSAIVWPDTVPSEFARGVTVHVAHTGGGIYNVGGGGTNSPDFPTTFSNCVTKGTLTPGATCSTGVTFRPQGYGSRTGTLTITLNGVARTVDLSGVGAPPIEVGKPPNPVVVPTAAPGSDRVGLRWINPRNLDWTETIVRGAAGTTPPATVNDGFEVYRGRNDYATARDLKHGTPYAFSMFARDAEGLVAAPATIGVGASRVTLTVDRAKAVWGHNIVLSGRVTDAVSGAPIPANLAVPLYMVDASGQTTFIDDATTRADGTFSYVLPAKRNTRFVATWGGDATRIGAKSSMPRLAVSSLLVVRAAKSTVARGGTIRLSATAKPIDRSKDVVFEQQVKGKWRPVATAKPNRKGVAVTKVEATKGGKATYRARRGGACGAGPGASAPVTVRVT